LFAVGLLALRLLVLALVPGLAFLLLRLFALSRISLGLVGSLSGLLRVAVLLPAAALVLLVPSLAAFAVRFLSGFAL